jgi:hypothetical protein
MREEWLVSFSRNNEEHSSFLRQASSFCSAAFGMKGSEPCLKMNVQSHGMRSTWFESMCILIPVLQCHTGYWSTDVIYCAHEQQKLGMGIYVAILLYRIPRYFVPGMIAHGILYSLPKIDVHPWLTRFLMNTFGHFWCTTVPGTFVGRGDSIRSLNASTTVRY